MGLSIILVECDLTSPAGDLVTLRFSDRAMFPMAATDPDRPNAVWDDRLLEPPTISRALFGDMEKLEPTLGVGIMTLANADRALDPYQGHVWGEVRVWRWIYGEPFSTARCLITGPVAGTPSYDVQGSRPGRVRLILYDYRLELERPLQEVNYSGANNGTSIIYEGDANQKGQPKPLAYGNLIDAHIPAPMVNPNFAGFQLHDGRTLPLYTSEPAYKLQIFDRGADAGIAAGGDLGHSYPDPATLGPWFTASNLWFAHYYGGLVKFNASPVGNLAFGFKGDAPGGVYVETPGPILARLLAKAGVPSGRIGASVAALACSSVIGVYVQDTSSAREVIGWTARSAPAAVLPDRQGVWQAIMIAPPTGPADLTLDGSDIIAIEADEAGGQGAGEFAVGYDRIWTTYRRDNLLPALQGTSAEVRLAETYRWTSDDDAGFKARFKAWRKLKIETALRLKADAEALTDTLKSLFGLRPDGKARRTWRVTLEMTDALLDFDLGATVGLSAPEYGVEGLYLLIGEEPLHPRRDQIIWTLWG